MVTSRTGAGVERVSQAGDAQMPTWGDQGLRRVFPSLELTTATSGAEHQRRQMRHMMRLQARTRQMEFEPRRQCSVEGAAWIGGSLVIIAGKRRQRNRAVLAKELQAGGYPRVVVRRMVSLRCWHT